MKGPDRGKRIIPYIKSCHLLHENDSIHKPSPQHNRRNSGVKWQTNTSTRRILRLKTPTPTKAHKSESVLKAGPADFQHSPLPPPRFDQEGKITPGINTKNEGPHVRLNCTLYENGVQRNPTQKELDEIFSVFLGDAHEPVPDTAI